MMMVRKLYVRSAIGIGKYLLLRVYNNKSVQLGFYYKYDIGNQWCLTGSRSKAHVHRLCEDR